ncbi:MAG: HPr(Ser) kinase/phosphatase [Anaerococcus sp.]|nr:HPr(Ser) kinase/phosphatase [Anaerococcus sp.]MDD7044648.1 HPr(Ser) kinase/phosphatase [Peptoniphilaceae bacterium]MDY2918109.1 HPr(Ser) kinase/phosphatase [Anaerococcus sp.]
MADSKNIEDISDQIDVEARSGSTNKTAKLSTIVENLDLEIIHKASDFDQVELRSAEINRPGLQLTGYLEKFPHDRIQVIGSAEYAYLVSLDSRMQYERFRGILSYKLPAIIFSYNKFIKQDIVDLCDYYDVTLLRSPQSSTRLISDLSNEIEFHLAPTTNVHGELIEVYGMGVLLIGKSSVGKSETALDLINRGHRLIADDMVDIIAYNNKLTGTSPDNIRHYMELRGMGIINIRKLYGSGAVKVSTDIDLVIELEQWNEDYEYDRLGLDEHYIEILNIKVPYMLVPVRAGRNLALIVEVAAMNQREKFMGYNAAKDLTDNIFRKINNDF